MTRLCEALYLDPADPRGPDAWGQELGLSARSLACRFEAELGTSLRSWRRRLRLFRSIELMGGGLGITEAAMALGYSAFVYAFRAEMGCSPQAYMAGRGAFSFRERFPKGMTDCRQPIVSVSGNKRSWRRSRCASSPCVGGRLSLADRAQRPF